MGGIHGGDIVNVQQTETTDLARYTKIIENMLYKKFEIDNRKTLWYTRFKITNEHYKRKELKLSKKVVKIWSK